MDLDTLIYRFPEDELRQTYIINSVRGRSRSHLFFFAFSLVCDFSTQADVGASNEPQLHFNNLRLDSLLCFALISFLTIEQFTTPATNFWIDFWEFRQIISFIVTSDGFLAHVFRFLFVNSVFFYSSQWFGRKQRNLKFLLDIFSGTNESSQW